MGSPPQLQGASRITGGIFRGKAHGNVFNIGDMGDVMDDQLGAAIGKVMIFRPGQDPATHKPQMLLKARVTGTLGPVLNDMAARFSPIKSKFPCPF